MLSLPFNNITALSEIHVLNLPKNLGSNFKASLTRVSDIPLPANPLDEILFRSG
jgi:hypothetical protein